MKFLKSEKRIRQREESNLEATAPKSALEFERLLLTSS
jgi:rRNA biogenesis protein RRP5